MRKLKKYNNDLGKLKQLYLHLPNITYKGLLLLIEPKFTKKPSVGRLFIHIDLGSKQVQNHTINSQEK